nr:helix-turn-helix transcriptional regulator [uncultured Chryseobacterium sp.]
MTEKNKALAQFGNHIRNLRKNKNLSQDKVVANSSTLTKATISEIENGKRNPEFTTILDLAKGLGVQPYELLDYDHNETKD